MGSSPLTRGKLGVFTLDEECVGLIPAHAGKTPSVSLTDRVCKAHPRSRGENTREVIVKVTLMGSSPLTRGKRA